MAKQTIFFKTCLGVFQGGGCRGAAFAGAYEEAISRGVHFIELAGTSAGSVVAALVGAGVAPNKLSEMLEDLDFRQFLVPSEPKRKGSKFVRWIAPKRIKGLLDVYYDHGMHSSRPIQDWVERHLKELLQVKGRPVAFEDLPIPTAVIATDLWTSRVKVWSSRLTPTESVAWAVRASSSIPVFFQPVDERYVDGGALSNLPSFVFASRDGSDRPLSSRILAFTLAAETEGTPNRNGLGTLLKVVDTMIEGAQSLQIELQGDVHVIRIPTGQIKSTDFEKMDRNEVKRLVQNGRKASASFFDNELMQMQTPRPSASLCLGREEMYTAVVERLERVQDVLIAEENTDFVYSLFPTLLYWRMKGIRVRVLLPKVGDKPLDGPYRRKLLLGLGVLICEADNVPVRAFVFDATLPTQCSAVVGVPKPSDSSSIEAIRYGGSMDSSVIRALAGQIEQCWTTGDDDALQVPSIVMSTWDELRRALSGVSQYGAPGVRITYREIHVNQLVSLTKFVREYKYKQITHLVELFRDMKLDLFAHAAVGLVGGKKSLITPPVVEQAGDHFLLIEGTTRAIFCRDNAIERIWCAVVQDVAEAPPAERVAFEHVRVVSRTLDPEKRYAGFNYGAFRHVESSVHPTGSLDD